MEVGGDGERERPAVEVGVVRPSGVKRRRWRREEAAGRGSRSAEQEVGFQRAFYTHRDSFESSDRRCTAGKRQTLEENGPDKVSWPV